MSIKTRDILGLNVIVTLQSLHFSRFDLLRFLFEPHFYVQNRVATLLTCVN